MDWMVELERIGNLELARLKEVFFRHIRQLLRTLSLLELLVVLLRVLGFDGVPQSRGYTPLLLGHPMIGLE
jgi:hypothetical protein